MNKGSAITLVIIIVVLAVFIGSYIVATAPPPANCVPTGTANRYGIPTSYVCP